MRDESHPTHRYRASTHWSGTTADGYRAYERGHVATYPPAAGEAELSSSPEFYGDAERPNPEQLLVGAASSCQLLSFLAVAARAKVDVHRYEDDAEGQMPVGSGQSWVERIVLRPHIVVGPGVTEGRLRDLVELAHRECYIANSLRSEILVTPSFTIEAGEVAARASLAEDRAAALAAVFDAPSRDFLVAATADLARAPRVAVDLGCGAGHTTALVESVTGAIHTIGLDSSELLLEAARAAGAPRTDFVLHDVRRSPWPVGDGSGAGALPDLAYGRLVLAHLPDPAEVALGWLEELAPGGRLLLEELDWIRTDVPALQHYLDLSTAQLAAQGAALFAGPLIDELDPSLLGRRVSSSLVAWPVAVATAAELFALDVSAWADDPAVTSALASVEELDELGRQLGSLASAGSGGRIVWGLRHLVLERAG